MNQDEQNLLAEAVKYGGLIPQDIIYNFIAEGKRITHSLVAKGYLEEVPREGAAPGGYKNYTYYRPTEKALIYFEPLHKKAWHSLKGDIRTIVVSAVTALVVAIITTLVSRL